jgi:hypothetical protein
MAMHRALYDWIGPELLKGTGGVDYWPFLLGGFFDVEHDAASQREGIDAAIEGRADQFPDSEDEEDEELDIGCPWEWCRCDPGDHQLLCLASKGAYGVSWAHTKSREELWSEFEGKDAWERDASGRITAVAATPIVAPAGWVYTKEMFVKDKEEMSICDSDGEGSKPVTAEQIDEMWEEEYGGDGEEEYSGDDA